MNPLVLFIGIYAGCLLILIVGQWFRQQSVSRHVQGNRRRHPGAYGLELAQLGVDKPSQEPQEPVDRVDADYFRQHFRFLNQRKKAVLDHVSVDRNKVSLVYRTKASDFHFEDVLDFMWRAFTACRDLKLLVVTLQCLKEADDEEKQLLLDIDGKVWAPFFSLRVPRAVLEIRSAKLGNDQIEQLLPIRCAEHIGVDAVEPYDLGPHPDDAMLCEIIDRMKRPVFSSMVSDLLHKAGVKEASQIASDQAQVPPEDGTSSSGGYSDRLVHINQQLAQVVRKQVQELEKMNRLKRYMSPQVVDNLLQEETPNASNVGARKLLTLAFVDVRGFTEISDKLDPEDLFVLLNAYLTEMTSIVYKHGGTIDKFVGDGIMIFFGAPLPCEDHAARAVAMALEMQQRVPDLAANWNKLNHNFSLGIGINTGYAHVGNVGSEHHMNYTAIGHSVNLAARLEDLAEPGQVLITERTLSEINDQFVAEALGEVKVKGIADPVNIYNVLGNKPPSVDQRGAAAANKPATYRAPKVEAKPASTLPPLKPTLAPGSFVGADETFDWPYRGPLHG